MDVRPLLTVLGKREALKSRVFKVCIEANRLTTTTDAGMDALEHLLEEFHVWLFKYINLHAHNYKHKILYKIAEVVWDIDERLNNNIIRYYNNIGVFDSEDLSLYWYNRSN